MLYRSPITRMFLAAVGVIAGAVFTFGSGDKWRSTPSLDWLAQAHIPLQVWGIAMIVYGLMLLHTVTRPAGYALGGALFTVFTMSLLATLGGPSPKNVITIAAMLDVVVFHVFSIRTAWATRLADS